MKARNFFTSSEFSLLGILLSIYSICFVLADVIYFTTKFWLSEYLVIGMVIAPICAVVILLAYYAIHRVVEIIYRLSQEI